MGPPDKAHLNLACLSQEGEERGGTELSHSIVFTFAAARKKCIFWESVYWDIRALLLPGRSVCILPTFLMGPTACQN